MRMLASVKVPVNPQALLRGNMMATIPIDHVSLCSLVVLTQTAWLGL